MTPKVGDSGEQKCKSFHFGPDGGVAVDTRECEACKHLLGTTCFLHDEEKNAHLMPLSEFKGHYDEVEACKPTVRARERKASRVADRVANQFSSEIVQHPSLRDPALAAGLLTTRSGRSTGRSSAGRMKVVVDRWKRALTHSLANLNWEVYSVEHMSSDLHDSIYHEGRETHIRKLVELGIKPPGECSCEWCKEEGVWKGE